jgi:hypothetical protein
MNSQLSTVTPLENLSIIIIYGDITIDGEGLQNLGLSSAFIASERGGIFILPHLM